jgi:hypothetical protein
MAVFRAAPMDAGQLARSVLRPGFAMLKDGVDPRPVWGPLAADHMAAVADPAAKALAIDALAAGVPAQSAASFCAAPAAALAVLEAVARAAPPVQYASEEE